MRARGGRLVLAFVVLASAFGAAGPSLDREGTGDDGTIVHGEIGKKLDAFMQDAENFPEGFNGCVLVAKDGQVLLAKGFGIAKADPPAPMRADALWDWCSVTKQFTAAAILKLEMQKKLKIDDPLKKHFKDVPKDKANVTVRQLLNHTSGLSTKPPGFEKIDGFEREEAIRWLLSSPVVSEPGRNWEYNNATYFLLAALIERLSGTTYENYIREQLFAPAGMKEAAFIGDGKVDYKRAPFGARGTGKQFAYGYRMSWGYRGAGGALASVFDMLKWDQALRSDKLLSKAAKEHFYDVGLKEYALGWEIRSGVGGMRAEHSGKTGDIITYYLRLLDRPVVVALALSYEPKKYIGTTANELAGIALKM